MNIKAALTAMRPVNWVKNGFVMFAIIFSGQFISLVSWELVLMATGSFCLLSSAVYLFNDICDRQEDRLHPTKRLRPIASGQLSLAGAAILSIVLVVVGLALALAADCFGRLPQDAFNRLGLTFWAVVFVALNLLYSLWLKDRVIIDTITIALGFVVRAMAGAAAIRVPISPWLVVCAFTVCLFIALTKRRSEIVELGSAQAGTTRKANQSYDLRDIDHMITVACAMALVTYALYCLTPNTSHSIAKSAHLVWTIPLVTYVLLRFSCLTRQAGNNDPTRVVVRDKVMWVCLGLYFAAVIAILSFGQHPLLHAILDY